MDNQEIKNIKPVIYFIKLFWQTIAFAFILAANTIACSQTESDDTGNNNKDTKWTEWYRPVDQPVFTTSYGNNHDAILFVEMGLEYPYHMIVSHEKSAAHLWRTREFSWSSADWELVTDDYSIGGYYEYDDGVKVDGVYYIYEQGHVYTYSGSLEDANGNWNIAGSFPSDKCNDIGVYYEDGIFHIFGEYGDFPDGPDGTSLSHYVSQTGTGDWTLVNNRAVNPNPHGGDKYGVGDATIAKIEGTYYLFCDRESKGIPYRIIGWKSEDINEPFEYIGKVIEPRSFEEDDWDNHRIQDGDIGYISSLNRFVMVCNMKDIDGNPGDKEGVFNSTHLGDNETRVVGFFYSGDTLKYE